MSKTDQKTCRKPRIKPSRKRASKNNNSDPRSFAAMIPFQLKEVISEWQAEWPEILKEFPLNILFANSGELRGALYEPDFATFSENAETASLTYRTVTPSYFRVRVAVNQSSGEVETQKYDGDDLLFVARGPDVKGAMVMTTMHGVASHEPLPSESAPAATEKNYEPALRIAGHHHLSTECVSLSSTVFLIKASETRISYSSRSARRIGSPGSIRRLMKRRPGSHFATACRLTIFGA